MQTFLPYESYALSAQCLDSRRLGNQRNEALVLLRGKWPNHPASKMWRGHLFSLADYGIAVCHEWISRGYQDSRLPLFQELQQKEEDTGPPPWLGREDFHAAHRSNLLRKAPDWYSQFGWSEPDDLPYVWPIYYAVQVSM